MCMKLRISSPSSTLTFISKSYCYTHYCTLRRHAFTSIRSRSNIHGLKGLCRGIVAESTGKGFGDQVKTSKSKDDKVAQKGKRNKSKGKQQRRVQEGPSSVAPFQEVSTANLVTSEEVAQNQAFEERLKALEKSSEAQRKVIATQKASEADILTPNYDQPPPLSQTLLPSKNPPDSSETGNFGPSQVALGAVSLILVVIFLVTSSGSDLGYATKRTAAGLGEEQQKELRKELEKQEEALRKEPNNIDALESSAVILSQIGEYTKATDKLERLTQIKADDPDVWRLLGEVYDAQGNYQRSIQALKNAFEISNKESLEILTLLADSYVHAGREAEAISLVEEMQQVAVSQKLGNVELRMLKAKIFSQWKGHAADAVSLYDELIQSYPDDFRPPLGKGIFLRKQGRAGDAERYFTQAKYLAPGSSKATVEALIQSKN